MSIKPTLRCPCEGRFAEQFFHYDAPPKGETAFNLGISEYQRAFLRCRTCSHFFGQHDLPLDELYESEWVDATYGDIEGMAKRFDHVMALPPDKSDNAQRIQRVTRFAATRPSPDTTTRRVPTGGRLLDVGAGIGVFPAAMRDAGWDVVAVEPDPRTVQMLTDRLGIRTEARDFLTLRQHELGTFTAVTFNKVLEHVEDPVELLAHAREFLEPSGFCYVEVPDTAAAAAGRGRGEFNIAHHHVFSPASLGMLGERSGLRVENIERLIEPSGKYTVYAFMTR